MELCNLQWEICTDVYRAHHTRGIWITHNVSEYLELFPSCSLTSCHRISCVRLPFFQDQNDSACPLGYKSGQRPSSQQGGGSSGGGSKLPQWHPKGTPSAPVDGSSDSKSTSSSSSEGVDLADAASNGDQELESGGTGSGGTSEDAKQKEADLPPALPKLDATEEVCSSSWARRRPESG